MFRTKSHEKEQNVVFEDKKFFYKLRCFFGIKTSEEKKLEERNRFIKRLSDCFTTIDLDLAKEAEEDKKKRMSESIIRPRLSFSTDELKKIDEIASRKREGTSQDPEIDFYSISRDMIKQIDDRMYEIAKSLFRQMSESLGPNFDSVMENLANKWEEIDKSERSCWVYRSDDLSSYEGLETPSEIANSMAVNRSVENIVDVRNRIIAAAEFGIMTAFENLLEEEVSKRGPTTSKEITMVLESLADDTIVRVVEVPSEQTIKTFYKSGRVEVKKIEDILHGQ